jgi:hypothetical protein
MLGNARKRGGSGRETKGRSLEIPEKGREMISGAPEMISGAPEMISGAPEIDSGGLEMNSGGAEIYSGAGEIDASALEMNSCGAEVDLACICRPPSRRGRVVEAWKGCDRAGRFPRHRAPSGGPPWAPNAPASSFAGDEVRTLGAPTNEERKALLLGSRHETDGLGRPPFTPRSTLDAP